ncbi:MAG: AMP-binding protein [Acidimicrobiales bacterium]
MSSATSSAEPGTTASPELEANLVQRVNVGDMLTRTAWRLPGKLALVDGDRRMTYGELNSATNRLAAALAERGYHRGDALALASGNSIEFLVTYYACAKLGVACVPLNLGWGPAEVGYVLDHSRARGIVVESQLSALVSEAAERAPSMAEAFVAPGTGGHGAGGALAITSKLRWQSIDDICRGMPESEPEALVEDRDPVSYLYTSGTTAAPKGVASSHVAVYIESLAAPLSLGLNQHDRSTVVMPLYHTAQLNGFATSLVYLGATMYLLRSFDPGGLLRLIGAERITQVFALPIMYRAMLDHPEAGRTDFSSLRLAVYAMAPMPDTELERAMEVLGCEFALGFGQTEMNPITTVFLPEHQLSHAGSVGTQVAGVQTGILAGAGPDPGGPAALAPVVTPGVSGEIVYRGPHAMNGYLADEQATRDAFRGGWFHSGDVGHFDADGLLWFEDRLKDVIKTGGENVSSLEVEKALYEEEARIQEVAVVAVPHERWVEALSAIVVPKPGSGLTPEDVRAAAARRLPGFKRPKAAVLVEELPHTSTGKVRKDVLRSQFKDLYSP